MIALGGIEMLNATIQQALERLGSTAFPRCQPCHRTVGARNPARGVLITSAPMAEKRTEMIIGCRTCSGDRRG
jgi:hypothetical protein